MCAPTQRSVHTLLSLCHDCSGGEGAPARAYPSGFRLDPYQDRYLQPAEFQEIGYILRGGDEFDTVDNPLNPLLEVETSVFGTKVESIHHAGVEALRKPLSVREQEMN